MDPKVLEYDVIVVKEGKAAAIFDRSRALIILRLMMGDDESENKNCVEIGAARRLLSLFISCILLKALSNPILSPIYKCSFIWNADLLIIKVKHINKRQSYKTKGWL